MEVAALWHRFIHPFFLSQSLHSVSLPIFFYSLGELVIPHKRHLEENDACLGQRHNHSCPFTSKEHCIKSGCKFEHYE